MYSFSLFFGNFDIFKVLYNLVWVWFDVINVSSLIIIEK